MYSIPDNLDSTEFSGWINQDLLLKDSRRTTTTRKRNYEADNVELEEHCDDLSRRVLRPRQNMEAQTSSGASRTRPIRSNRSRRRQFSPSSNNDFLLQSTNQGVSETQQSSVFAPDVASNSSSNDVSYFQALASYYWPQNYFVAHSDPSIINRVQPPTYSQMNNIHLSHQMPHFDPWILHNYLLASSNYSTAVNRHVSPESHQEDSTRSIPQLGFSSIASGNSLAHNFIWQYPFLLNPTFNQLHSQTTRPPEIGQNIISSSNNPDSNRFQSTNTTQRDSSSNSNEASLTERMFSGMYSSDPLINYTDHILPNPFSFGSLCPYHNTSHIIHHNQPTSHQMTNISSNLSESTMQHSFNPYPLSPDNIPLGHYWNPMTQSMRPANYPMNGSNIDTLLHLAAHFEQRKRGITREELDKLPTHRFKSTAEKSKRAKMCSNKVVNPPEDSQKCLVCLDNFESKQSIRTLGCQHEFHAKCIDKWLKINRTCPLCRADAFDGTAHKDGA